MNAETYNRVNSGQGRRLLRDTVPVSDKLEMLTLEQIRALPEDHNGSGVYFLWRGDQLNYIGASRDLGQRIYWHHCAWRYRTDSYRVIVPHDRVTVLHCAREDLTRLETDYLRAFSPPFNKEKTGKHNK